MFTFSMTFVSNWVFNFSLFEQLWLELFFNRFIFLWLPSPMYLFSIWKRLLRKLTALLIGGDTGKKIRQLGDIKVTPNTYARCWGRGGKDSTSHKIHLYVQNIVLFHIKALLSGILSSWRSAIRWNFIPHMFVWSKWKSGETIFLA